jgi:hypothetical protein
MRQLLRVASPEEAEVTKVLLMRDVLNFLSRIALLQSHFEVLNLVLKSFPVFGE